MKKIMLIISLSILVGSAYAQDTSRHALAGKLLELMNMEETIEQSFAKTKELIPTQMEKMQQQMGQKGTPEQTIRRTQKMVEIITAELNWQNLRSEYIALYADVFTETELQGLIEFYESPAGQAFVKKQPELTQRTMMLTNTMMLKVMPKIQALIKDEMKQTRQNKAQESSK